MTTATTSTFNTANKKFNEAKKQMNEAYKLMIAARNNRTYDAAHEGCMNAMLEMRRQLEEMLFCLNTTIELENEL